METIEITSPVRRRRRKYSLQFKASVVKAAQHPGVSLASVALAHGLNANLLRRWVVAAEQTVPVKAAQPALAGKCVEFVPVQMAPTTTAAATPDIRIELQRGASCVRVNWPASAAAECAAWLRDWLR